MDNFDKNLNISYVDESLPAPDDKLISKHYFCSIFVYLSIYFILQCNPFFKNYFIEDFHFFYIATLTIYAIIAPIIFFVFRPKSLYMSNNIKICDYLIRIFKKIFNKNTIIKQDYKNILNDLIPTYHEKQALMLIFIKVFFGVLMVKFLYNNILSISASIDKFNEIFSSRTVDFGFYYLKEIITENCDFIYGFIITILFSVDIIFFVIGYLSECQFLNNKVRSVDTSILGVICCLICYPPFNNVTSDFVGWNQNDYAMPQNGDMYVLGWILRIIALFFLLIYASASVALGTKASNLTNRGTVSIFPYNIVRHPAYISKNLFWLFTTIPLLIVNFQTVNFGEYIVRMLLVMLSWIAWATIYYVRSITEERHLMQDPEYQEYAKKVRWRFIPFVI